MLSLLSKVAKHILGIPSSSAKSERLFSTGGIMVSKKRHRLGPGRIENLLILKENRRLVEEFKEKSGRVLGHIDDAFKVVELEADTRLVPPLFISELFASEVYDTEEDDDEMCTTEEESSDNDFEIVFD